MQNQSPSKSTGVSVKAVTPGHLVVSAIVTALVAAGDAGVQYFQSNGLHFSAVQLIGTILVAFFAALGTGIISLEKNPTIEQAIDGAIQPHITALSTLVNQHSQVASELTSVIVWLNNQLQAQQQQQKASAPTPALPATQQPQQVQQVPFSTPRNPQQVPAINLAQQVGNSTQQGVMTRHWGDTNSMSSVSSTGQ